MLLRGKKKEFIVYILTRTDSFTCVVMLLMNLYYKCFFLYSWHKWKFFYVICVTCTFTHKLLSLLGIWENLKILTFNFIETSTLEFNLIDDCLFLLLVISSINRLEQGLLTYVPLDRESIYTLTRLSWTTKICLIWKRLIVVHLDIIYINETSILYYQHHMQTNFDWKGL